MSDKLEQLISEIVLLLMLDAHNKGMELSFADICKMVGIPDEDISQEADTHFTLNQEFVDALHDKDLRNAMIERCFSTIH